VFIYIHQVAPSSNVTWPGTLRVCNNAAWSAVEQLLTVLYEMRTKGLRGQREEYGYVRSKQSFKTKVFQLRRQASNARHSQ